MAQLDDVLFDYVKRRSELLRSSPSRDRRRLSVRALLLGHPSMKTFSARKDELPKTRKLIDEIIKMSINDFESDG
jgi:single-stranded DNA-specific DHH superfamily exonuclease